MCVEIYVVHIHKYVLYLDGFLLWICERKRAVTAVGMHLCSFLNHSRLHLYPLTLLSLRLQALRLHTIYDTKSALAEERDRTKQHVPDLKEI